MDVGYASIATLGGVIALNYLVVRTELARRFPPLFWAINLLDFAGALLVLLYGVPGLPEMGLVRLMVALVLMMHVAQNFRARVKWTDEENADRLDAELEERRRFEAEEEARR